MKKLISILFILTLCLMAITAPAMAQLTFQSESQSQSEEVEMVDGELDDAPVTEAEFENARMTLEMVAKALEDFKPSELYTSLSEITQASAFLKDFWKPDMTAEMKNFLFTLLKPEISNLDNSSFLEDAIREIYKDEKTRADYANAGIEWLSENSLKIYGFMTLTVTGNTYVYTDATGKEILRLSLSTGSDPDSILVTLTQNPGENPTVTEILLKFEDETILVSSKDELDGKFYETSRISFDETNLIKITSLKDDLAIEVRFIPEDYQIKLINTPDKMGSDKAAEKTPASEIILELNPDKDLIDFSVDDEKLIAVFFYPKDKEISIVGSSIRDWVEVMGGADSITLKFDDEAQSFDVSSGETSLLKIGFDDAASAIDISFDMGGDAGMVSGMSLTVDPAAKKASFTMMGMEMFSLVLDVESETAVITSLNMQTMENEESVMTLEDIALLLRGSNFVTEKDIETY